MVNEHLSDMLWEPNPGLPTAALARLLGSIHGANFVILFPHYDHLKNIAIDDRRENSNLSANLKM